MTKCGAQVFGLASKITVGKENCTLVAGQGHEDEIKVRCMSHQERSLGLRSLQWHDLASALSWHCERAHSSTKALASLLLLCRRASAKLAAASCSGLHVMLL